MTLFKIKSNYDIKHPFTIQAGFYNKYKKLLGTVVGSISNLHPKSTKILTTVGTGDYSKSARYKIDVNTMTDPSTLIVKTKICF